MSSSFSKQPSHSNWTIASINKLRGYKDVIKDWIITNEDYSSVLCDDRAVFVYLDAPYDIKDVLYGKKGSVHRGFDHDQFALTLGKSKCAQLISYNADLHVRNRFKDWQQGTHKLTQGTYKLTYTMPSTGTYMKDQKKLDELVLIDFAWDAPENGSSTSGGSSPIRESPAFLGWGSETVEQECQPQSQGGRGWRRFLNSSFPIRGVAKS